MMLQRHAAAAAAAAADGTGTSVGIDHNLGRTRVDTVGKLVVGEGGQ